MKMEKNRQYLNSCKTSLKDGKTQVVKEKPERGKSRTSKSKAKSIIKLSKLITEDLLELPCNLTKCTSGTSDIDTIKKCSNSYSDSILQTESDYSKRSQSTKCRVRKTSSDELKAELVRKESHENTDDFQGLRRENLKKGYIYHFRESTFGRLTDFERFVLDNKNVEFKERCYPSNVGEECAICDTDIKKALSSSDSRSDDSKCKETSGTRRSRGKQEKLSKRVNLMRSSILYNNDKHCAPSASYGANGHSKEVHKSIKKENGADQLQSCASDRETSVALNSVFQPRLEYSDSRKRKNSCSGSESDIVQASESKRFKVPGIQPVVWEEKEEKNKDSRNHSVPASPTSLDVPSWMYIALDCEMVGTGIKGKHSALARCSIVDYDGNTLYDRFVLPNEPITDYRTPWSGITPGHMKKADTTSQALQDIHKILKDKIIIGHSVYNDFRVLQTSPPFYTVRDTAQCKELVRMAGLEGQGNGLKKLAAALLGRNIQKSKSGHCSVEDARASLDLFKLVRAEYEIQLYTKWANKQQTMKLLCEFVSQAKAAKVRVESSSDGHFLQDEYWPHCVLEEG